MDDSPSSVALAAATAVTAALEDAATEPATDETPAALRLRKLEESLRKADELSTSMVRGRARHTGC